METTLETNVKTNIFNIWSKINALTQSWPFRGGGVKGFRREKLYPHAVPYGIGCHFHPGVGGGGFTEFLAKKY